MCIIVCCLSAIHSDLGIVVAADIERSVSVDGVDPVCHFWMLLYDSDGGNGKSLAVFHTLKQQTKAIKQSEDIRINVQSVFVLRSLRLHIL